MPLDSTAAVYSWNSLPIDAPMELLTRRRIIGEKAMLSYVTLEKGCLVPTHSHANEQFVCMLEGCLKFKLGVQNSTESKEVVLKAGEVLHLPSNLPHEATAIERSVVLDIFSPPSQTTGIDKIDRGA